MKNKIIDLKNQLPIGFIIVSLMVGILYFSLPGTVLAQCKIGEPAPDFMLRDLNGEEYKLSQFKNQQKYVLLSFIKGEDSGTISKLVEAIAFFRKCNPTESYHIIAVMVAPQDETEILYKLVMLQEETEIPLTILVEDNAESSEVLDCYEIEGYPTFILLRDDLCVRKVYSKFTVREESAFYQYLNFLLTCQKENSSSECDDGVCPPPPGYQ